jgi:hypothetical protein
LVFCVMPNWSASGATALKFMLIWTKKTAKRIDD